MQRCGRGAGPERASAVSPHIAVDQLSKTFRVPVRGGGMKAALRSLLRREHTSVAAVDRVNIAIEAGEIVGFLGPNGAGKTTLLKMLTGLLFPTGGAATVLGHVPWQRAPEYLRRISLVMGQRSQLEWDLPVADSFQLHAAIYRVERQSLRQTQDELVALLELEPLLRKPVRTLSLGERMKCELCVALLHRPAVLFLDEPTLGVDVTMQARIRQFIAEYNRRYGATIILTSHYMADVTALCKRVAVIHQGRMLFDGPLAQLSTRIAPFKVIAIDLSRDVDGYAFDAVGQVLAREQRKVTLRVPREAAATAAGRLLTDLPVLDLTIEDPPIEDVIQRVFAGEVEGSP